MGGLGLCGHDLDVDHMGNVVTCSQVWHVGADNLLSFDFLIWKIGMVPAL